MTATAAAAIKSGLFTLIQGLDLGGDDGVTVGYGPLANLPRDWVVIGKASGPIKPAAYRNGGRLPRNEDLSVRVYIGATWAGGTGEEVQLAEARAVEIYTVIVNAVADDPKLAGVPGLLAIWASQMELDSNADDDFAYAWITLTFDAKTHIK